MNVIKLPSFAENGIGFFFINVFFYPEVTGSECVFFPFFFLSIIRTYYITIRRRGTSLTDNFVKSR